MIIFGFTFTYWLLQDDLVHILGHEYRKVNEENTNSDIMEKNDLIEFLLALFIDMDFEKAKTLLSQIQTTYPYANDYFLHDKAELLSLNCRILVSSLKFDAK